MNAAGKQFLESLTSEQSQASQTGQTDQVICLSVIPKAGFRIDVDSVQFPLYWVSGHGALDRQGFVDSHLGQALQEILVDPLLEELWYSLGGKRKSWIDRWTQDGFRWFAERQFLPGVTDNLARTVEEALHLKGLPLSISVASGTGYLFSFKSEADQMDLEERGTYKYFHPLTDRFKVHDISALYNRYLQFPAVHLPERTQPQEISLDINDAQLMSLSRERLLALNLNEMQAIKRYYQNPEITALRQSEKLPPWPTDVELEVIAQTWSEHCKHNIFNAHIRHTDRTVIGTPVSEINSLYKTYIQSPTYELMKKRDDLLSVFEDNSGVVRWDKDNAVCFKVETHNSPCALEPYGGALTGILGVNRDVLGTGLGAKPIFNTDIFCFAYPSSILATRPKLLPPETIIQGVRRGVQDGGNKSGIPTVNGAICFHDGYRAKPLVFCGTGGILPLIVAGKSGIDKHTQSGETIVMVGGRVGKDGIHGATFSSESLHEGSPVTAVQIGDPFTQKRVIDFVLAARDLGLITGITDNGAGGLSSSVGEMARLTGGAALELDHIPLKYPGLSDYEIVISESQERMTFSTRDLASVKILADKFNVEATPVGTFDESGYFKITRDGNTLALLDLNFLHKGVPVLELESEWTAFLPEESLSGELEDPAGILLQLLSHPNVCSREPVVRQYDHEVQGASVIKPFMGTDQNAPCDAAVITPVLGSREGLVVSNGICPLLSEYDPHLMAICAVDEAVRNAVCVGANPESIVLLDNFCWPDPIVSERNPDGKRKLGQLVKTCQGLAQAVAGYGTPLISGKDSMKNDFDDRTVRLSIPPTLLVSAMGRLENINKAMTMEFKSAGDIIYILSAGTLGLAHSLLAEIMSWSSACLPDIDLDLSSQMYKTIYQAINDGLIKSAHDLSEGGLAVALSECCTGSGLGAVIYKHSTMQAGSALLADNEPLKREMLSRLDLALFGEGPARIIVTVDPANRSKFESRFKGLSVIELGRVTKEPRLRFIDMNQSEIFSLTVLELLSAWQTALPFD